MSDYVPDTVVKFPKYREFKTLESAETWFKKIGTEISYEPMVWTDELGTHKRGRKASKRKALSTANRIACVVW